VSLSCGLVQLGQQVGERRCKNGLFVLSKAAIGKGCSISACVESGIFVEILQDESGPGEVTVEQDAGLVCEGNNTGNDPTEGDFMSSFGGVIKGIAEEKITVA